MRVPQGVPDPCPPLVLVVCVLCVLLAAPIASPSPQHGSQHGGQHGGLRSALSPERQGLRPSGVSALGGLSVPALLERPDRLYDPQPGDLNATLLRAKLGRHFDPRVMSVQRPAALRRQHKIRYSNLLDSGEDSALLDDDQVELDEDSPFRRNLRGRLVPAGEMPESIATLDMRGVRLPDGSRLRTRISPRLRRKLQHFLWAYTACPVQRRWRDLGLRFWPRWLKEGHCPDAPCSIPPGMRCRPSSTRHQALLRWHCRPLPTLVLQQDQGGGSGSSGIADTTATRHCSWIKVEYPIITECSCGCADDRYS
ncbi:hypothetical protein ONE63_007088 [Megalurothrips usitatus]|uniref:Noggin-like n=1 Tax=Megalurothrips usitatus TaxID=439358 RepID=A0AAV7XQX1_9NEOP|nr:hypothetical protein ONE63_007088 [Megalurothrips usitatus]